MRDKIVQIETTSTPDGDVDIFALTESGRVLIGHYKDGGQYLKDVQDSGIEGWDELVFEES